MTHGRFTIPARVYLTAEQRDRLMLLVRERETDMHELLTELLVSFLDHLPDLYAHPPDPEPGPGPGPTNEREEALRQRRAEVRRLRLRLATGSDTVPPWIGRYLSDLEREIRRLEQEQEKDLA
ncbi:MAG: hypothetical protein HC884_14365 [Chloroflexaceae bacterium]|nr:hypothetical protein [Chloroflexaceae bacterium]